MSFAPASAPTAAASPPAALPPCPAWLLESDRISSRPLPLYDSHVHLADAAAFSVDALPLLLSTAAEHGVGGIMAVAQDTAESERIIQLARLYKQRGVSAGAGLHPVRFSLLPGGPQARKAEIESMEKFMKQNHSELACVGEVGLDFSPWILQQAAAITQKHAAASASAGGGSTAAAYSAAPSADWKSCKGSPAEMAERAAQTDLLRLQVRLALQYGLPLNIHSRNASKYVVSLLREEGIGSSSSAAASSSTLPVPVLLHAFDGSLPTLREALRIGCFFSATTSLGRDEHVQRMVKQLLSEGALQQVELGSGEEGGAAASASSSNQIQRHNVLVPSALMHMVLESDSPALHPIKQPLPVASASSGGEHCCAPENNTPANLYCALLTLHALYVEACDARAAAEEAAARKRSAAAVAAAPAGSPSATPTALSMQELAAVLLANSRRLFPRAVFSSKAAATSITE